MSKYVIEKTTLIDIADAVRGKNGTTEPIVVSELASAITNLPTGGSGGDLPEEAFFITGDCQYRFAYDGWNWFAENYGDRVITENISNCANMFRLSKNLNKIPLVINGNASSSCSLSYMFNGCDKLIGFRGCILLNRFVCNPFVSLLYPF